MHVGQKIGLNCLKYDYRQNQVLDFTGVENFFAKNANLMLLARSFLLTCAGSVPYMKS